MDERQTRYDARLGCVVFSCLSYVILKVMVWAWAILYKEAFSVFPITLGDPINLSWSVDLSSQRRVQREELLVCTKFPILPFTKLLQGEKWCNDVPNAYLEKLVPWVFPWCFQSENNDNNTRNNWKKTREQQHVCAGVAEGKLDTLFTINSVSVCTKLSLPYRIAILAL